jgi:uncharacterized protein YcfL
MKKHMLAGALLLAATTVTGCASNHLIVEQPAVSAVHAQSVTLDYQAAGAAVTADAAAYLQSKMQDAFFGKDAAFTHGKDLTIRYRFVGFDRGSRLSRYLLGGLAGGEAQMVIEAEFVAPDGTVLSKIQSQGRVNAGFFGGSSNSAIDGAVKEIRDYALANFH